MILYILDICTPQGIAYTRVVTPYQFGRILHFLSLNVAPEDLKLLIRKFEDPASGDVNYPAFVQTVDGGMSVRKIVRIIFVSLAKHSDT